MAGLLRDECAVRHLPAEESHDERIIHGGISPLASLPLGHILTGNALTRLRELPPGSIDTVITSPPYFGLRNYGHPGQLGLERNIEQWVAEVRAVCQEVARVLKPTGSLWLNVGDGFVRNAGEGAVRKSLLLGPERLVVALGADGWVVRNKVIWAKTNPMPASVRDRLGCTYEVVYFLVRSRFYFFDLDVIRVPHRSVRSKAHADLERRYPPPDVHPMSRPGWTGNDNAGLSRLDASGEPGHPLGKNPGDVWLLPTAGFKEAHFAVFPVGLVERSLLATCPEKVCVRCGQP